MLSNLAKLLTNRLLNNCTTAQTSHTSYYVLLHHIT